MEVYVKDKKTFKTLGKVDVVTENGKLNYQFVLNEEQNATSTITVLNEEFIKINNYLIIYDFIRPLFFIIDQIGTVKDTQKVTLTLRPMMYLFNRKVIEESRGSRSLEEYIKVLVERNFINTSDKFNQYNFLRIEKATDTNEIVPTNSENFLFNLSTFITNCNQNKNIKNIFKINNNQLILRLERKKSKPIKIDISNSEVLDVEVEVKPKLITKVEVLIRNTFQKYTLYLRKDRTTTENINDAHRLDGDTEVISVDEIDKAREEALNVFKGNRYGHSIRFSILNTSKLIDVNSLEIGDKVEIYHDNTLYQSYISELTYTDSDLVDIKLGNLKTKLTEKLKETNNNGNKLDTTGGNITGELKINDKRVLTVDDLTTKGYIEVRMSGPKQYTTTEYKVQFDSAQHVSGSFATYEDGGIKILRSGKGKISVSTFVDYSLHGYVMHNIKLIRNGNATIISRNIATGRSYYSTSDSIIQDFRTGDRVELHLELADFGGSEKNSRVRGNGNTNIIIEEL